MPVIPRSAARHETGTSAEAGTYEAVLYSDAGGLTQFGAFVETLAPGARSSERHWHECEDEFLYMLSGTATLIEDDGPHALHPGDAVCWPAGIANGHHIVNDSAQPCSYLVAGSRMPDDRVHYSDVDRLYVRENGVVRRTRRDGSPLDPPQEPPA